MKLIWLPEGQEQREWDFEPAKLLTPEAEALEAAGGDMWDTFERFGELFLRGNLRARRVTLWIMRRRTERGLKLHDVVVRPNEIIVTYSDAELAALREFVTEALDGDAAPEEIAEQVDALTPQQVEDALADEPPPLDHSVSDGAGTVGS